ncbi:dioxygenase [Propioniciclava sp. MC1595]|uniref:dioxygenase family protein n=1 Tax=Propioniciclava sp. MC1595 TaxID=2760308 RepID=UPI001FB6B0CD|nr:class III extradiol ring-cleavage dioxygenase [Propioniciclava sp. MC1595]
MTKVRKKRREREEEKAREAAERARKKSRKLADKVAKAADKQRKAAERVAREEERMAAKLAKKYYDVIYDAPVAPELASRVAGLVDGPVYQDPERGLDHGAYVPMVELFPEADLPVVQMSLPTLDPSGLYELGRRLAPLRDEGTLIIGSGFTTHNLRWINPRAGADAPAPTASVEFDQWAVETLERRDIDAILDFEEVAPAASEAHPRTEHWAPLYVALGAAEASGHANEVAVDGFWFGLSKRSWQFN